MLKGKNHFTNILIYYLLSLRCRVISFHVVFNRIKRYKILNVLFKNLLKRRLQNSKIITIYDCTTNFTGINGKFPIGVRVCVIC